MKLVLFASVSIALASCQTTPKEDYSWIKKGLDVASAQLQLSAEEVSGTGMLPRSIRTGYDTCSTVATVEDDTNIPDLTGKYSAKLLGEYKWIPLE